MPRLLPAMVLAVVAAGAAQAQNGVWNTADGLWDDVGAWTAGIANGAGNTADFTAVDVDAAVNFGANGFARNGIGLAINRTIGNLTFADANLGTPGGYELYSNTAGTPEVLTLEGATPTITVAPMGPIDTSTIDPGLMGTIDDVLISASLAGTSGFTKAGAGTLTLSGNATALTGPINVNAGRLRFASTATYAGATAPINLASGAILDVNGGTFDTIKPAAAGGAATIAVTQSTFLSNVQGLGTGETLNLNIGAGRTASGNNDWATGGFANVNMTGTGGQLSFFRGRFNGGGWNPASFANSHVNLDNVQFFTLVFSSGNDVSIGQLSGVSTGELKGSGQGGATRYLLGGLGNDSVFAGTVNGAGGMSINKVGAGTQTFSGAFVNTMIQDGNNDPIRQGGTVRVSEGTLALTNAATSIPGGTSVSFKTTIDVLSGATLDVSGTSTTFTSSPFQKIQGVGTIVGPFNHVAGEIRPADVAASAALTSASVATAGTINFNGNLSFNGGTIVYDMNATPGVNDLIQVNGITSVSGGGIIDPHFLGANPAPGLTYTVLNSSGGFSDAVSGWTVNWAGRGVKPAVVTNGNLLQFTTTPLGAGADIVWTGAVDGVWDIQTTQNWDDGALATDTFFQGDTVRFDDTGANPTVTLASAVAPANMVVDSDANNYSFSGNAINASGSLIKRGTSTLTLGATNSFTSATIESGTVNIGAAPGALGSGSLTLGAVGAGGTLFTTAAGVNNTSLVIAGGDNVIRSDNGTSFGVPALSGSGNLTFSSDDNSLRLDVGAVDPNFSGNVTFGTDPDPNTAAGMLVRLNGQGGDFPNATVNLVDGASLVNRVGASTVATLELGALAGTAGTSLVPFSGGGAIPGANWTIGGLNTSTVFAGTINDGGNGFPATVPPDPPAVAISSVTKVGTGTLTLSGLNTYTGDTVVEAGTLSISNAYLADAANVFIAGGANMELLFAGNDTVNFLYLNGVPQAPGVYTSANSGGRITGTGGLLVSLLGPSIGTPGDYNSDGFVDAADYTAWRDNLATNNPLPNDNNLGVPIGQAHYDLWVNNFGNPAVGGLGATGGAVPEPSSVALAGLMLLVAVATARRGCR